MGTLAHSGPLELATDSSGSVTFGWLDERTYYARFGRCLSARLGELFALRLRTAVTTSAGLHYFGDARDLESYDLLARSAFVRVVSEQRSKFEGITLLGWSGAPESQGFLDALGSPLTLTRDAIAFETSLLSSAPRARDKLTPKPSKGYRSRWPLRR